MRWVVGWKCYLVIDLDLVYFQFATTAKSRRRLYVDENLANLVVAYEEISFYKVPREITSVEIIR